MTWEHFNNKLKLFAIVFILFPILLLAQKSSDYRLHSNTGLHYAKNVKYGFNNWTYYYRSPKIMKKFHLQFDIHAFRMLGNSSYFPLLGVYNTGNLRADYHIPINEKIHVFPLVGIQMILDPQQASEEGQDLSGIFAVAPIIGASGKYLFKNFDISADFIITQYLDGNWIELAPKFTYTFWKGISVNTGINNIWSIAYNRNTEIGVYPFWGINIHLTSVDN